MCIIIHKPEGIKLDEVVYRNSFIRNDHGAGLAYVLDGKLVIDKGYHDVEKFIAAVKAVEELELVIHCRLMSKGEISDENCHPFAVVSKMFPEMFYAIAHNGTLACKSTPEKSDTRFFVEEAITPILDRDGYFFDFAINRAMMGSYIGLNNKFCIMRYDAKNKDMEVFIVNRKEGIEYNGCWFSNLSFTDDQSRYIIDSDHKRIQNWKPTLFVEKKAVPYGGTGGYFRGTEDFFPGEMDDATKDWVYHAKFGWYNKDTKYTGPRSLKDFQASEWGTPPKKDPPAKIEGKSHGKDKEKDKEQEKEFDPMEYLSEEEKKVARKMCIEIVKNEFPEFSFKNTSTNEVAQWARAHLRVLIVELNDMTNEQLMNHILYGEEIPS